MGCKVAKPHSQNKAAQAVAFIPIDMVPTEAWQGGLRLGGGEGFIVQGFEGLELRHLPKRVQDKCSAIRT